MSSDVPPAPGGSEPGDPPDGPAVARSLRLLPALAAAHGLAAGLLALTGLACGIPWAGPAAWGAVVPLPVILVAYAMLHHAGRGAGRAGASVLMRLAAVPFGLCHGAAGGWLAAQGAGAWPLALVPAALALAALAVLAPWRGATAAYLVVLAGAAVAAAAGPAALIALSLVAAVLAPMAVAIGDADRRAARLAARERRRLAAARTRIAALEQDGAAWFWETDAAGRLTRISPAFADGLGTDQTALVGQPLDTLLLPERDEPALAAILEAARPFSAVAVRTDRPADDRRWLLAGRPLHDSGGRFAGFRGSGVRAGGADAPGVERWRFDPLTGLPNALSLRGAIAALAALPGGSPTPAALLLVALDGARGLDEKMGFQAADTVARHAAARLRAALADGAMLYRVSDHRFAILQGTAAPETELARLASEIDWKLSRPFRVEGAQLGFDIAVGIATGVARDLAPGELERRAGLALDAARARGGTGHQFHRPDLETAPARGAAMAREIEDALGARGLEPVYRPILCANSETVLALEAMVRWRHAPSSIFPADSTVVPDAALDALLLSAACLDAVRWPAPVRLVLRLSPECFADAAFPAVVADALARSGLEPRRLELDVGERTLLAEGMDRQEAVARLKRIGVRLAVGDFGTGYSALGYLGEGVFDRIRIDRDLVRDALAGGGHGRDMVEAIVSLADALGLDSLVEDVESAEELALIRALGCSQIQGGVFGAPLDAAEAAARMAEVASGEEEAEDMPRRLRAPRVAMLRSAALIHQGQVIAVRIRNISATGAQIEIGVALPSGAQVALDPGAGEPLAAAVRWWQDGRMGIAFKRRIDVGALMAAGWAGRAVA